MSGIPDGAFAAGAAVTPRLIRPGVHLVDGGALFTIFSRHAERIWLMLFDAADAAQPAREIELVAAHHRLGDFWHVYVDGVRPGQFYLYRMQGRDGAFDPQQWLLDPYAQAIDAGRAWGGTAGLTPGRWPRGGPGFPKGVIVDDSDYDWQGDRAPGTRLRDTVIYEAHVRGFTAHPSSGVDAPGTYRGFIGKIPYLKDLGVTAVEFLPLQEFNEMELYLENGPRRALRNFWGYSTVGFFAPMSRYAAGANPANEFRDLVRALHAAGIEVILDVVFNHTAESDEKGPVYSFKGIDRNVYYMMKRDGVHFENFSGCGNTVSANHPVVQEFILDCLRYWVGQMHVDGFRFDLASVLARDTDGRVLERAPVIDRISEDPALRHVKLFAEAWDAAGLYQVGAFPHSRWSEWNGLYRDEVRRAWAGTRRMMGNLATRLAGSSDLYDRAGQSPTKSVNFVTCHDGFTLADLVRYESPHNAANGEDGRDGEKHNFSCNHGVEGPSDDPRIESLRLRQQKNHLATLLLSQGVPMLLAGDEFGRTQEGNNNAYCQDNELSWIDWSLLEKNRPLYDFVRRVLAFRHGHRSLRRGRFYAGQTASETPPDILWFGPGNRRPDWDAGTAFGCLISGDRRCTGATEDEESLFLVFNIGTEAARFVLPGTRHEPWSPAWSTQETGPVVEPDGDPSLTIEGRSVTALVSPLRPGGTL